MADKVRYPVGTKVVAVGDIKEEHFNHSPLWVHAVNGDEGTVIHVNERGEPTVRFVRTGTATIVNPDEVRMA